MRLHNIMKKYDNKNGTVEALKGIDLDISTVGITVILGSSGCGKTSLLNILAGIDKNYEGTVEGIPDFYYLTQEFELMEAMSVLDNLLIVENNKEKCKTLIEEYGLAEQCNKKVSTLSNGQKKRVQFMKAMLMNPSLLLCDEITAALDHENAELMMEKLKEYSKANQVLLVTHDIALAEKYADRIIKINQGKIESDIVCHEMPRLRGEKEKRVQDFKATRALSFKRIKSDKLRTVLQGLILSCCIFSIYLSFNLFMTIREQSDILYAFESGSNFLVSQPDHASRRTDGDTSSYLLIYDDYESYLYRDILNVIEECPEIIAVEAFYSMQYEEEYYRDNLEIFKTFTTPVKEEEEQNPDVVVIHEFGDNPLSKPFLLQKHPDEYSNHVIGTYGIIYETDEYGMPIRNLQYENQISVYTLVNDYTVIPLLAGNYPASENEILLDLNTAAFWMELKGIEGSAEDLIGQKIIINIMSQKNMMGHELADFHRATEYSFVVSGIASVQNDYTRMAFFNSEFGHDPILASYVSDYEKLRFQYVNFILDSNSDPDETAEKINAAIDNRKGSFVRFQGKGLGIDREVEAYKDPTEFFRSVALSALLFGIMIIVSLVFDSSKMRKEKRIIEEIGYSSGKELLFRNAVSFAVTTCLLVVLLPLVSRLVNGLAASASYAEFLKPNAFMLIAGSIAVYCLFTMAEYFVQRKR